MPELGGGGCRGGHYSHFLVDQLTLLQTGRTDSAHPLLLANPKNFSFRNARRLLGPHAY
jgi:hypothetical protein